jgi:DNA adenine methylase
VRREFADMPRGTEARKQPTSKEEVTEPRPFLKWAGGKSQLLGQFRHLLPPRGSYRRYFEPFLGSAALFFHLRPEVAFLSDVNEEIVDCYRAVRGHVEAVIRALARHRYEPEHYYSVREESPHELVLPARAARTIYLNKTGFNGLYRVNSAGRFNVPIGRYTNPGFKSPALFATLRVCSGALAAASIGSGDFERRLRRAREGDFVYLDPPYAPVSATSDFTSYAAGGFGWSEQERLARVCRELWARGVRVMLSNSDVPSIRELYEAFGFRIRLVEAARSINSRATRRGKVREVVVRNYDERGVLPRA